MIENTFTAQDSKYNKLQMNNRRIKNMGRMTGFEPATTEITTRGSTN